MILRRGDLWRDSKAENRIFTGNNYIRTDGALVMGRGAAAQVLELFPGINYDLGAKVRRYGPTYGLVWGTKFPRVGVFQVKYHFRDDADLELIQLSADKLRLALSAASQEMFAINMPGIGFGRLPRKDVLPIMQTLPDNLEVWEL